MKKKHHTGKEIIKHGVTVIKEEIEKITHLHEKKEHTSMPDQEQSQDNRTGGNVTAPMAQPPTGVSVTQANSTAASDNILNQPKATEQATKRAVTEVAGEKFDPNYYFEIEQGQHKVMAKMQNGLNYNYFVECQFCHWQGRYVTRSTAETAAKEHLALKFPRRG